MNSHQLSLFFNRDLWLELKNDNVEKMSSKHSFVYFVFFFLLSSFLSLTKKFSRILFSQFLRKTVIFPMVTHRDKRCLLKQNLNIIKMFETNFLVKILESKVNHHLSRNFQSHSK